MNGNGNQFTVKELLQAHIQDDKEFKIYIRDKFEKGTGKIAANRANIKSISNILKYGIGPLLFLILGWLAKLQIG